MFEVLQYLLSSVLQADYNVAATKESPPDKAVLHFDSGRLELIITIIHDVKDWIVYFFVLD